MFTIVLQLLENRALKGLILFLYVLQTTGTIPRTIYIIEYIMYC